MLDATPLWRPFDDTQYPTTADAAKRHNCNYYNIGLDFSSLQARLKDFLGDETQESRAEGAQVCI